MQAARVRDAESAAHRRLRMVVDVVDRSEPGLHVVRVHTSVAQFAQVAAVLAQVMVVRLAHGRARRLQVRRRHSPMLVCRRECVRRLQVRAPRLPPAVVHLALQPRVHYQNRAR